jgi:hypothetical protein
MEKAPTRNRDAGIGLLRRAPFPPARAWRVAAPPAPHALSRPSHVDHEDAVIVEVGAADGRAMGPIDSEDTPIITVFGWREQFSSGASSTCCSPPPSCS